MTSSGKPQVRRVQAYPIEATLKLPEGFKKISVIMINTLGVIALTPNLILKVGSPLELAVELPAGHGWIKSVVRVVKTYDRSSSAGEIERLAELHFTQLEGAHAKLIARFMAAIGQKA